MAAQELAEPVVLEPAALDGRLRSLGHGDDQLLRAFRGPAANAPDFRRQSTFHE